MFGLTREQEQVLRKRKSLRIALDVLRVASLEPLTEEAIASRVGAPRKSVSPRLCELVRIGCVRVAGRTQMTGTRTAKLYQTVEGVRFARYLQSRNIRRARVDTVSDTDRELLHAARKAYKAWSSGTERQRRNALVAFVDTLQTIRTEENSNA